MRPGAVPRARQRRQPGQRRGLRARLAATLASQVQCFRRAASCGIKRPSSPDGGENPHTHRHLVLGALRFGEGWIGRVRGGPTH